MPNQGTYQVLLASMLLLGSVTAIHASTRGDEETHRVVADTALARVFSDFGDRDRFASAAGFQISLDAVLQQGLSFGALSAQYAEDDLSRGRFHPRAQTPYRQVTPVTAEVLNALWTTHETLPAPLLDEDEQAGVVANYLRHHFLALRFAHAAGEAKQDGRELLIRALAYEAMALGYLVDAFASGHLLSPTSIGLARLQTTNRQDAHRYFNSHGAYVANFRGVAWQTFGDPLMLWYPSARMPVLEAAHWAMREVFLVYVQSLDDRTPAHLATWRSTVAGFFDTPNGLSAIDGSALHHALPSLWTFPFPVVATWSLNALLRTPTDRTLPVVDPFGLSSRQHIAQLRSLHDPDTEELEPSFLYQASDFPSSYLPPLLQDVLPDSLIRYHPDVASVRYHQRWWYPASYKGLLLYPVAGYQIDQSAWAYGVGVGLGVMGHGLVCLQKRLRGSILDARS